MPTTEIKDELEPLKTDTQTRLSINLFNLRPDWMFALAAGFITLAVLFRFGALAGMAAFVFFALWLTPMLFGRAYYMLGLRFANWWNRRHKGKRWEAKVRRNPARSNGKPQRRPRPPKYYLPFEVHTFERDTNGQADEGLALLHNRTSRTDAIIISGIGMDGPSDIKSYFQRLQLLANALKKVAASAPGYAIGHSLVYRRGPFNDTDLLLNFSQNFRREVVMPEVLERNVPRAEWSSTDLRHVNLQRLMYEMRDMANEHAGQVEMLAIFTIQRQGIRPRHSSLAENELNRLPINKLATTAVTELANIGVAGACVLGAADIRDFLRASWDYTGINEYWLRRANPNIEVIDEHWPAKRIYTYADHLVIDDTYHATIVLRECPTDRSHPFAFLPLMAVNVPQGVAISLVGEVMKSNRESRALNTWIPFKEALNDKAGTLYKSPATLAREARDRERVQEIYASRYGASFKRLVLVSAGTRQELEAKVDTAMTHFDLHGSAPKRVMGEALQERYFWSAATGVALL